MPTPTTRDAARATLTLTGEQLDYLRTLVGFTTSSLDRAIGFTPDVADTTFILLHAAGGRPRAERMRLTVQPLADDES